MEKERKMARNQDGKLVKAAPFCSYLLMYLRRAVMKRQRERLPLHNTKGEERWKDERKAPSVPIGGERWDEAPIHRLDVSRWWIWGGAERGKIGKRRKMRR